MKPNTRLLKPKLNGTSSWRIEMTFMQAVLAVGEPVASALRNGKQALGNRAVCLTCTDPRRFVGSVGLDAALHATFPNANRWDYGVGFAQSRSKHVAVWVEIHPASEGEVDLMLQKLFWLRDWLRNSAPHLDKLTERLDGSRAFFWVATGGVSITPKSRKAKLLQQAGLDLPRRCWHLD
jgi:hypothetical protein